MKRPKAKPARGTRAWAVVCKSGAFFSIEHESYILDAGDDLAHDQTRDMVRTCDAQYQCGPHRVVRVVVTREDKERQWIRGPT